MFPEFILNLYNLFYFLSIREWKPLYCDGLLRSRYATGCYTVIIDIVFTPFNAQSV